MTLTICPEHGVPAVEAIALRAWVCPVDDRVLLTAFDIFQNPSLEKLFRKSGVI